eukprot:912463-Rhodomonas_salina.1
MSLRSKEQIRVSPSTSVAPSDAATDGSADPPNEIPLVFDYTDDDDYGDIFSTLSSGKSDPTGTRAPTRRILLTPFPLVSAGGWRLAAWGASSWRMSRACSSLLFQ